MQTYINILDFIMMFAIGITIALHKQKKEDNYFFSNAENNAINFPKFYYLKHFNFVKAI